MVLLSSAAGATAPPPGLPGVEAKSSLTDRLAFDLKRLEQQCGRLSSASSRQIADALSQIDKILDGQTVEGRDTLVSELEKGTCFVAIESLQRHEKTSIFRQARQLLRDHFGAPLGEEGDDRKDAGLDLSDDVADVHPYPSDGVYFTYTVPSLDSIFEAKNNSEIFNTRWQIVLATLNSWATKLGGTNYLYVYPRWAEDSKSPNSEEVTNHNKALEFLKWMHFALSKRNDATWWSTQPGGVEFKNFILKEGPTFERLLPANPHQYYRYLWESGGAPETLTGMYVGAAPIIPVALMDDERTSNLTYQYEVFPNLNLVREFDVPSRKRSVRAQERSDAMRRQQTLERERQIQFASERKGGSISPLVYEDVECGDFQPLWESAATRGNAGSFRECAAKYRELQSLARRLNLERLTPNYITASDAGNDAASTVVDLTSLATVMNMAIRERERLRKSEEQMKLSLRTSDAAARQAADYTRFVRELAKQTGAPMLRKRQRTNGT